MITELRAQNLKSWQDTGTLQFAPLTGAFGANSSGKISILQVLLMLKQTVKENNSSFPLNFGKGDFDTVIHKHDKTISLGFSVSWKLPKKRSSVI